MTTLSKTESGHQKFREGRFEEALQLYSDAISAATLDSQRIALRSNRDACFLKLQRYKEAAEECGAVLQLDDKQTGALMLRAQTLVILKDYQSALFDVSRLIEIDPNSQVYKNLQARIKTQLALEPIPEAENESPPPDSPKVSKTPSTVPQAGSQEKNLEAVPKPKSLDYSRWDKIGDDLSDDDEPESDDSQPQYRYRLRAIGLRAASY